MSASDHPASPFSAARLHELHWIEQASLGRIAEIAAEALDGSAVTADDVREWMLTAGVQVWTGSEIGVRLAGAADHGRLPMPQAAGAGKLPIVLRRCIECGHEWPPQAFSRGSKSCRNCEAIVGRSPRKTDDLGATGLYRCNRCRELKPIEEMVQRKRPNRCKECMRIASAQYYQDHRAEVISSVLARKKNKPR